MADTIPRSNNRHHGSVGVAGVCYPLDGLDPTGGGVGPVSGGYSDAGIGHPGTDVILHQQGGERLGRHLGNVPRVEVAGDPGRMDPTGMSMMSPSSKMSRQSSELIQSHHLTSPRDGKLVLYLIF